MVDQRRMPIVLLTRLPSPRLRRHVRMLWASDGVAANPRAPAREHVLPTGCMHLAFRLGGPALRLFENRDDAQGFSIGHAVVGGARSSYYVREAGPAAHSVGVQLQPGAGAALFGVAAGELADRHTPLDALWGREAGFWAERLADARSAADRLDLVEDLLCARLDLALRGLHPAIAHALQQLDGGWRVGAVVEASGLSHRHFIDRFRDATGLAPKRYERVRRFQGVVSALTASPGLPWVELALQAGYSDQSHFNREFVEFAGVPPQAYRRTAPLAPNHVAVPAPV